jgi:hypothetical protein
MSPGADTFGDVAAPETADEDLAQVLVVGSPQGFAENDSPNDRK